MKKKSLSLVFSAAMFAILLMGCENNAPCSHDWKDKTVAATCTEAGSVYKECALCGEKTDITKVDALGHDWDEGEETVPPTETEMGLITYTCLREGCGETKTEELPALGHIHNFSVNVTVDATCTQKGYTATKCSGCEDLGDKVETDALGHDWDEGEETVAPTETTEGVRTFTCKRTGCNETKTEVIPELGHTCDYTFNSEIVLPTCKEKGYTKHICKCGEFTTDTLTDIDPTNHDWDEGTITTTPTYETEGVITYSCKRDGCSETKTAEIYGTKLPSAAKAIGDIVFADGSATPYTEGLVLSDLQKSKAETVIFYIGGNKDVGERVLGVHIKNSGSKTFAWCSKDAKCYNAATGYNSNKGSVHWPNICKYDPVGTSAENRATMYPAFNYVLENFPSEYFMPAYGELLRIYASKDLVNAAIEVAGGIKFVNSIYITSSYAGSNHKNCHYVRFSDGHSGGMPKENLNRVCAIREYK